MNDTIELMRRHRSIRTYEPAAVPDEHVRVAVEAGQSASTSSAVQAYSVIRVTDRETRETLVELTGSQAKVASSGAFFVVCGDTRRHRLLCARAGRAYDSRLEAFLLAVIDATLFAQNLVLAFESMGYGICYIGGLRNRLEEVDRLLALPEGIFPLYGLCVGVPGEEPMPRPRLPVEAVCFDDRSPHDDQMLQHLERYDDDYRSYLEQRGARPGRWSDAMVSKFTEVRRTELASYYLGKGARLD
ncbi:MAG: NADPH-dependent oxidoreductase [Planctomycetota bacterium]|jgi:FMN reductase (NADPH)